MSMIEVQDSETSRVDRRPVREAAKPIDPYGRFLKLADVMQSIGVSQAMVYKLIKDKANPLPAPVKIGRASVWIERDIVNWKSTLVKVANSEPETGN